MILVSLWTQKKFGVIFKIIQIYERYDGANIMQIEQHWVYISQTHYSIFRAKNLETTSATEKQHNLKNWQSEISPDIRKEMEDSRLNAVKQPIPFG